jgi:glycosyltransferase involved in cell wall biosynthesis
MSANNLVSVVIPTYNRTHQTFAAVESVLAQTYPHVEVIVVDDGSTNGSDKVVEQFVNQKVAAGHRVIFCNQPNQGASTARNTGIAKAQGKYIGFLDSDDLWLPEKLEWQMKALEQFKDDCFACVTDARLVNDSGMDCGSFEWLGRHYPQTIGVDRDATQSLAKSFCFWISTLIADAEKLRQIGGFNPRISFVEDRDLQFRLSLVSPIAYVNKLLIRTDRTPSPPGSDCRPWDKKELQFSQQRFMLESWLQMGPELPDDVRRTVKRSLGAFHSYSTNWYLETQRYAEARHAVSLAVQYKTTPGIICKYMLTWLAPSLASYVAPKTRAIGTGGHAS